MIVYSVRYDCSMFDRIDQQRRDLIRERFRASGVTMRSWAETRGFAPDLVYAVLNGRIHGVRGRAHDVAVALGLKPRPPEGLLEGVIERRSTPMT